MRSPNILFILIDDMGARDLGCTGSTFYETPHIDRLAAEGVRCENGYAASALCSPARAAILTGRAPARVGITNYIPGNATGRMIGAPFHFALPRTERTVATALRENGYHTWHVGKWHLGGAEEGSLPTDHGFDVNIGGCRSGMLHGSHFAPWVRPQDPALPGLDDFRPGEYMTDRLTDEAIQLVRQRSDDRPFFLHLSHYTVHVPIQAPADGVARCEARARRLGLDLAQALVPGEPLPVGPPDRVVERRVLQSHPVYAAMVENLDWNVGRLLAALDECGLGEETLVVFTSDNGGLATAEGSPTCNLPYAEGKGWSEEGGLRVPLLWRWPGRLPRGSVCREPVWQCDFYPTFLDAAGLPSEPERHADGLGVLQALVGGEAPLRDALYWHYPHYSNQGGTPTGAIRRGDWKLIEWFETGRTALYDLSTDISESFDLAEEHPELASEMRARLAAWRTVVGARMPTPNPDYVGSA